MHKIEFPAQLTYFIFTQTGEDWVGYGENDTDQCTWSDLTTEETFLIRQEWIDRLNELGVDTSDL